MLIIKRDRQGRQGKPDRQDRQDRQGKQGRQDRLDRQGARSNEKQATKHMHTSTTQPPQKQADTGCIWRSYLSCSCSTAATFRLPIAAPSLVFLSLYPPPCPCIERTKKKNKEEKGIAINHPANHSANHPAIHPLSLLFVHPHMQDIISGKQSNTQHAATNSLVIEQIRDDV